MPTAFSRIIAVLIIALTNAAVLVSGAPVPNDTLQNLFERIGSANEQEIVEEIVTLVQSCENPSLKEEMLYKLTSKLMLAPISEVPAGEQFEIREIELIRQLWRLKRSDGLETPDPLAR